MKEQGTDVLKFVPGTVLNDAQALAAKMVLYRSIEACQLSAVHAQEEGYALESIEVFLKQYSLLQNNIVMVSAVVVETSRAMRIWNTYLPLPGRQSSVDGEDEFSIEDLYVKQAYDCLKRQSDKGNTNTGSVTIRDAIDSIASFKAKEELIGQRPAH